MVFYVGGKGFREVLQFEEHCVGGRAMTDDVDFFLFTSSHQCFRHILRAYNIYIVYIHQKTGKQAHQFINPIPTHIFIVIVTYIRTYMIKRAYAHNKRLNKFLLVIL